MNYDVLYELSRTVRCGKTKAKARDGGYVLRYVIRLRATGAGLIPLQVAAAGANTDENTKLTHTIHKNQKNENRIRNRIRKI